MKRLRGEKVDQQVRGAGVQLGNFDGKGWLLIAKDRKAADELLSLKREGWPMQTILGIATGAGMGKPAAGQFVVQTRDQQGNVIRETLTDTEQEAQQLADKLGENSVVMRVEAAIKRRMTRVEKENKQFAKQREQRATGLAITELPTEAAQAAKGATTRTRAAARVLTLATQKAAKEETKRVGGFADRCSHSLQKCVR
jgi:hypothetical protein